MATLRFEPELVQAMTDAELEHARHSGDVALVRHYHALADPLYDKTPQDDREQVFARFHTAWFFERGWTQLFAETWNEFPELETRAPHWLVLAARLKREEGAVIGRDDASVCLRVLPLRFSNREQLRAFVRHELLHAADMLDPSFGYQDLHAASLTQANQWADLYHTVWCAYVDARLTRRGAIALRDGDVHRAAFETQFADSSENGAARFDQIWNASALTHADITALARAAGMTHARRGNAPGARCPLCRFPTFEWAIEISPAVADAIRIDFSAWSSNDGACARCVERYEMVAT